MTKKKKPNRPPTEEQRLDLTAALELTFPPREAAHEPPVMFEECGVFSDAELQHINARDAAPGAVIVEEPHRVHQRLDKGLVWELDPTWAERAAKMASAAGLSTEQYLDSLLRRAWVGFPTSKRGGQ